MRSTKRCGPEMVKHLRDEKTLPLFDIKLELSTRQVDLLSRRAQAHATARRLGWLWPSLVTTIGPECSSK